MCHGILCIGVCEDRSYVRMIGIRLIYTCANQEQSWIVRIRHNSELNCDNTGDIRCA